MKSHHTEWWPCHYFLSLCHHGDVISFWDPFHRHVRRGLVFWAGPTRVVKVVDSSRSSILSKKHTCRVFMHLLSSGWYLMINNWKNTILDTFFNENRLTWSPLSDFWCGFCELLGQTGLLERKLHTTLGLFRAKMHQIAWFFNVF